MPLLAKDSPSEKTVTPAGMHQGVCYGVVDIGTQPSTNTAFPSRRKVLIMFELPAIRIKLTKDGKQLDLPRAVSVRHTLSLASKGNLRPMLESWRGRPFTAEELDGFDLAKLVGVNGLVNVVHEHVGEKTYANVKAVTPLVAGMTKVKPESPTIFFSLSDVGPDFTLPDTLPDWIKGLIMNSEEFKAHAEGTGKPGPNEAQMANIDPEADPDAAPF